MLLGDLLSKPIVIDGQDVILVDDQIGDTSVLPEEIDKLIEIEPPDAISPGFYINEDHLMAIRTQYPDHTPYGLWQTLYHSGMLTGADYLFLPFDEGSGRYAKLIHQENSWVPLMSGVVTAGELSDDPLQSLEDTHRLNVDTSLLALPDEPAMLHRERLAMLQKRSRKRYWATGLICLGIIGVAALYEGLMYLQYSAEVAARDELRQEQQELGKRIASLTQSRLIVEPDYSRSLQRIFHLHTIDPTLSTAQESNFKEQVVLLLNRNTLPFLRSIDWVIPEVTNDGLIAVALEGKGKS